MIKLYNLDQSEHYTLLELINYWWGPDPIAHKFYDEQSVYSCVILSVVTTGLIGAYIILVYHIRKYFKD